MRNKAFPIYTMVAAIAATSAWLTWPKPSKPVAVVNPAKLHEGALATKTDATEVFRRAFWRGPDASDRILHAERREWTKDNAQGLSNWQWFLAVEPGPALTKWLRDENAFGLRPTKSVAITGAPAWFPSNLADYEIHAGGMTGKLVLLFSRDGKTLYATSSGKGFQPGLAEKPSPAPAQTASVGRLPNTPPPNPLKP